MINPNTMRITPKKMISFPMGCKFGCMVIYLKKNCKFIIELTLIELIIIRSDLQLSLRGAVFLSKRNWHRVLYPDNHLRVRSVSLR